MGIGVMLAILHSTGKLPEVIRSQKILANLGLRKQPPYSKTMKKILFGSKPPQELRSFR